MERERAEMVAEVEAQIERALQSMAMDIEADIDDFDEEEEESRPPSRMSNASSATRIRKVSEASKVTMKQLRSVATESTLAESYGADGEESAAAPAERHTDAIEEVEEEEEAPLSSSKRKRFSTHQAEVPQDGMTAVDEGISQKSDKIAQKVLEIQHKVSLDAVHYRY